MDIKLVTDLLLANKVICLPTETVLGLASIVNKEAYYNLVNTKNRPLNKAFPVCFLKEDINNYCEVNSLQQKVIDAFLPGPLTVVLKRKETSEIMGNELGTVAVRCSNDLTLTHILESVKKPLYLTSANLANEEVCKTILEAKEIFKDKVSYYIEGTPLGEKASTIVDLTLSSPKVLRQGLIKEEDILKVWRD